jgi:hypothetical protein
MRTAQTASGLLVVLPRLPPYARVRAAVLGAVAAAAESNRRLHSPFIAMEIRE